MALILLFAIYIFVDFSPQEESSPSKVNIVNDVTQLNPIEVAKVISPKSIEDIQNAISDTKGKLSIGGGRYSQGGQIALEDHLHLDMREFNQVISFDPKAKEITVQSGIRWRDIQDVIDPVNLSIKIMQSYANFTVGGSLSVNVHGRYMGEGPIIRSVKSIKVVLADGSIVSASPHENSEVFFGVIGGYGGLGVIAEATLELVPNLKVGRKTDYMTIEQYASFFEQNVKSNPSVVFHNADIYPPDYTHVNSVSWVKTEKPLTVQEKLISRDKDYWWQPKAAKFVADTGLGKWMRQHIVEPIQYSSEAVQWRNYEASYDVKELEPKSRQNETYVLREYFVPIDRFDSFSAKMSGIFKAYEVNVLNVSIRHALPDTGSLLAWAREEVFAFVVYYRQGTSERDKAEVKAWSREMIDAVISEGGAYYLPYQLHATTEQFNHAYPRAKEFFELKKKLDPNNRFSNKLWEQHYDE
ncbi:FAD-binding oxidoreductase [Pseudoalteromonas luteoviolacea]|uniref:FAD-binding oxidoreductase n=1 Tax=Pseudoalteromonas luteoviolacea TaxID=43657 RepID=UPI001FFC5426|nr:FAD-binding oxidoreductase [Pseudoalteromonas luteoviolacea]